jgi:hypothetical protein
MSDRRRVVFEGEVVPPDQEVAKTDWVIDWNDERIRLVGCARVEELPAS